MNQTEKYAAEDIVSYIMLTLGITHDVNVIRFNKNKSEFEKSTIAVTVKWDGVSESSHIVNNSDFEPCVSLEENVTIQNLKDSFDFEIVNFKAWFQKKYKDNSWNDFANYCNAKGGMRSS